MQVELFYEIIGQEFVKQFFNSPLNLNTYAVPDFKFYRLFVDVNVEIGP